MLYLFKAQLWFEMARTFYGILTSDRLMTIYLLKLPKGIETFGLLFSK